MHWYKFNIGDYARSTRHLNQSEDLAYRRLIDLYYDKEKPLISDVSKLARLIDMRENHTDIQAVLDDFFVLEDDGYHQSRMDNELVDYHGKADQARANGKLGGRPKKPRTNQEETQRVNSANQEETGSKAKQETTTINQQPGTNNQEQENNNDKPKRKPKKRFSPPSLEEVKIHVIEKGYKFDPDAFLAHYESNGWMVGKNKMKCWKSACVGWSSREKKNGKSSGFNNQDNKPRSPGDRLRAAIAEENRNGSPLGAHD